MEASTVSMPPVLVPRCVCPDAGVLGDVVHAFDDDAVLLGKDVEDLALLAAVAATLLRGTGDDLNQGHPSLIFAMIR